MRTLVAVLGAVFIAGTAQAQAGKMGGGKMAGGKMAAAPARTPEAKIQEAMTAAPGSISKDATIMDWPAKEGEQTEVQKYPKTVYLFYIKQVEKKE